MDFENLYYTCKDNPEKYDRKIGKFVSKSYKSEGVSDIAHAVKSDNPDLLKKHIAINKIAQYIIDQNILTSKDYIVPAPQHTGRAEYTLDIAKIISRKTGCKIADVLGCHPRDTLFNLKKKNGAKSIEDSGLYLFTDKFPKYNVWFLDNVTATGKTFDDARKLIPHLKPLIYSISPRLKVKMKNRKPYFIRENNESKIKALTSKIEEYKELCSNMWIPQHWKVAYSKVPEGLKLTIDTDEWFDKENPLGHLIDFILDIYDSDYSSSVKELTGINVYSDVDFLGGEKSDYATYLIKNNESNNLKESKEQKSFLEILKEMLPFDTEWKYDDDAGDFLVDINNPKRFVIQYGEEGKHKGDFIVSRRITKGDSWTWSTRFFKTIPEAIDYLKVRLNENRTYFGNEIKEVVDWLIESPYNNWQEEDRDYLMNCDNEKLFKYESDTFDLECAERSLYESNNNNNNNKSKNMKLKESRIIESFERVLNEHSHIIGETKYVIRGIFEHNGEKYWLYYGEGGKGYDSFPTWQPYLSTAIKFKEFPSKELIKNIVSETDKNDDDNTLTSLKVFNLRQGGVYTHLIGSETVFER